MTVLLTGATGNVGPHVARALIANGAQVRALVRDPERAGHVLPREVELSPGDFAERASVRAALRGADALFLLTPHGPEMSACQGALAYMARQAGVRVVKLSGTSSAIRPDGPDACRQHWEVEEQIRESGVPHVILRPNAFMQPLVTMLITSALNTGTIANPLGNAGLSLIDCRDIGEVAATVLVSPEFDGRTLTLTGPTAPTYPELAARISDLWGITVRTEDVTPQQAGEAAITRGATPWVAEHLVEMFTLFRARESEYVTDHVQTVIGRAPRSVEQFLQAQAAARHDAGS